MAMRNPTTTKRGSGRRHVKGHKKDGRGILNLEAQLKAFEAALLRKGTTI